MVTRGRGHLFYAMNVNSFVYNQVQSMLELDGELEEQFWYRSLFDVYGDSISILSPVSPIIIGAYNDD